MKRLHYVVAALVMWLLLFAAPALARSYPNVGGYKPMKPVARAQFV